MMGLIAAVSSRRSARLQRWPRPQHDRALTIAHRRPAWEQLRFANCMRFSAVVSVVGLDAAPLILIAIVSGMSASEGSRPPGESRNASTRKS
jgi:hypothetical protein